MRIRDFRLDGEGLATRRLNLAHHGLRRLFGARVIHRDVRAFRRKAFRDRRANASGTARDQRRFSHHATFRTGHPSNLLGLGTADAPLP